MKSLLRKAAGFTASGALAAAVSLFAVADATAQEAMPDFGTILTSSSQAPGVWYTDRYAPAGFSNVGPFQGRNDVLGIQVSPADGASERPGSYSSTFYNYQGRKYDTGVSGDFTLSADLWVDESWASADNGLRAPSMWGTAFDASGAPSYYPIIGFSNTGGTGLFKGYDGDAGAWLNFNAPVNYGAWNTLQIAFNQSASLFSYYVNGALQAQLDDPYGTTGLGNVIMQSYNFDEATEGYVAQWSNTAPETVPEPASLLLMGTGLLGLAGVARRRRERA